MPAKYLQTFHVLSLLVDFVSMHGIVKIVNLVSHFILEVGLPSQVTRFTKRVTAIPRHQESKSIGFLNMIGMGTTLSDSRDHMNVQVTEVIGPSSFNLTTIVPTLKLDKWMGPAIKMSLPSLSGRTQSTPGLLKYSCKIQSRVRAVRPAEVSGLASEVDEFTDNTSKLSAAVMLSKPVFALKFSCMTMQVEAPVVIFDSPKTSLSTC